MCHAYLRSVQSIARQFSHFVRPQFYLATQRSPAYLPSFFIGVQPQPFCCGRHGSPAGAGDEE